jgi:peptidoglycan/xylan/chitin deacetylase (PgdA/CDA1 family)
MSIWPGTCVAAVSLTFDDGLGSHLSRALPALDERGLRGTFYLNPRGSEEDPRRPLPWREKLAPWGSASAAGHEMGNHTLRHPCSLNIDTSGWQPDANLRSWTLDRIEADIAEAQRRIAAAFPAQRATSFAYPCYESTLGSGADRVCYTPVVARYCNAGRAGGALSGNLANDPPFCDRFHLSSWPAERLSGPTMIGLVERAAALGRWGIFTFHGVDEGHLSVSAADFAELLDHLARRRDAVWVAPVAEVADLLAGQR